jgi:two-component system chemotaxis response regulator CheY
MPRRSGVFLGERLGLTRGSFKEELEMGKMILVVDDSASMRQVVCFAVSAAGYEVLEACDGVEAVSKLSTPVDMMITDLNMPRMDGIDLIRHVRTKSAYKHIPILMLTTESQPAKKEAAKAAGATCWMVKPFRPDQLLAVVGRVLA